MCNLPPLPKNLEFQKQSWFFILNRRKMAITIYYKVELSKNYQWEWHGQRMLLHNLLPLHHITIQYYYYRIIITSEISLSRNATHPPFYFHMARAAPLQFTVWDIPVPLSMKRIGFQIFNAFFNPHFSLPCSVFLCRSLERESAYGWVEQIRSRSNLRTHVGKTFPNKNIRLKESSIYGILAL